MLLICNVCIFKKSKLKVWELKKKFQLTKKKFKFLLHWIFACIITIYLKKKFILYIIIVFI